MLGCDFLSIPAPEHNGRLFPVSVDYLDHETMISEMLSILDKTPE